MKNVFESIPHDVSAEVFSELVRAENVRIERIVSKGHSSPEFGWYDQAENEWVIVLQGEAIISFENKDDVHLVSGSYTNIPKHEKHKVSWTTPETETVWLAVHYK
ncbi:MAG: cupin domain-containing protein [Arenicella sp.]